MEVKIKNMNTKLTRIALTSIFLFGAAIGSVAQDGSPKSGQKPAAKAQKAPPVEPTAPQPVVYTTSPKLTVAKIGEGEGYDVRGKISFTIQAANADDTIAGLVSYTIPDDARQNIAAIT